jgi:hypothetical protein
MKLSFKFLRFSFLILALAACVNPMDAISIQSYILRDRIVVTDRVLMKKALYVAFSLHLSLTEPIQIKVNGTLWNEGKRIADTTIQHLDTASGTIVFDLPYQIPSGQYFIKLEAISDKGETIGKGRLQVQRDALKMFFEPKKKPTHITLVEVPSPVASEGFISAPNGDGFIVFSRNTLKYVFPNSRPQKSEIIEKFSIQVARNEFESIPFSIFPFRSLGLVSVSASDLVGPQGIILKEDIEVAAIKNVDEGVGLPEGYFRKLPTFIEPVNDAVIEKGKVQSFWLTLKIGQHVAPGDYDGEVVIQTAQKMKIPIHVRVLPITLEDIPGIQYFMLSTYEMTELVMPWSKAEKEKIYQSAVNVYKDYKDHGMTTLAPASPFVLFRDENGQYQLDDIFASIRAGAEVGFRNPMIWYMGQLIQTAKPKHPGNILGFDSQVHVDRLKTLVKTVLTYTQKNGLPDVLFLPIDESDDPSQDPKGKRQKITPLLLQAIAESGGKSVLTRQRTNPSPPDYLISGIFDEGELQKAHSQGVPYFLYNNDVTLRCDNPAFARYIYGYYTWRNQIDGMSSWTFQTTQNSRGLPTADTTDKDVFLAYPHPNGPLSTLKWEAIREGIDDHKAIYQLVKRKEMLEKKGMDVGKYEQLLYAIRERSKKSVACLFDAKEDSAWLQGYREKVLAMAVDAEKAITK